MPPQTRMAAVSARRGAISDPVEASLASDTPYVRDGYSEILVCTPQAVDLTRARDGLPLLMHHDRQQIAGRVYGIAADGHRVNGAIQFFDTAPGREGAAMVSAGHRELSVGYVIDEAHQDRDGNTVVTRWTLLEVSVVAIPADSGVGIARNHHMTTTTQSTTEAADLQRDMSRSQRRQVGQSESAERERVGAIVRTAAGYREWSTPEMIRDAIEGGHTVEQFNHALMSRMQSGASDVAGPYGAPAIISERGDNPDLARGFSLQRAIGAEIDPAAYLRSSGREKEVSKELRQRMGFATGSAGLMVPAAALFTLPEGRRDMQASAGGIGANLVQTTVMGDMLLPALRARSVAVGMGVRVLTGLTGPTDLPRVSAGTTVGWFAENDMANETATTTVSAKLSPKRVSGYVDISRQLILTSSVGTEEMVRGDLQEACIGALDTAVFVGTGASNQPTGIWKAASIGSVVGGTNGATLAWSHILDLEKAVDDGNGLVNAPSCGYVINTATRSYLKRTSKVSGVAEGLIMGGERIDPLGFGLLNGYPCGVTSKMPNNLTKGTATGVCNLLMFGDFSQAVLAIFGGAAVEIVVDPYSRAKEGLVEMTANLYCDVAVRQPLSFATMEDAKLS